MSILLWLPLLASIAAFFAVAMVGFLVMVASSWSWVASGFAVDAWLGLWHLWWVFVGWSTAVGLVVAVATENN